jgi:hypothetical protein
MIGMILPLGLWFSEMEMINIDVGQDASFI